MKNWYEVHEQGAGYRRMEFLWWVYKIFGIRILKGLVCVITFFIAIGARGARRASRKYRNTINAYEWGHGIPISRFSSFAHICAFACSAVDKVSAICDKNTPIKFEISQNQDWTDLQEMLSTGQGIFFICSHLGNIEALCAIPNSTDKCMHAFMDVGQSPVFRGFIDKHSNYKNTIIHPTNDIDITVASDMYDALRCGELVMMAGDRQSPNNPNKTIDVECLGHKCSLPVGTLRFARACAHPIFAIANIKTSTHKYRVFVKKLDTQNLKEMAQEYINFLQNLILKYPKQWFNFFDFWNETKQ